MELNKFEDSIKEKLEKRTLEPSKNAWNTLSERLDTQVEKRNNKPYWWLGLAASVIGVLFVVSNVMDSDMKLEETQEVAGTTDEVQKVETINIDKEENAYSNIEKSVTQESEVNSQKVTSENIQNASINKQNAVVAVDLKADSKEKDIIVADVDIVNETLTFEEQKIKDVVAQVQSLKAKNKTLTNADIEALLMEAQKEIALNRLYDETHGTVDANALLQDVEDELDQSFRSKVFEAIKASYNTVKTTVAQRNE